MANLVRFIFLFFILSACTGKTQVFDLERLQGLPPGTPFSVQLNTSPPQNRSAALIPVQGGDTLWLQAFRDGQYLAQVPPTGMVQTPYQLTFLRAPADRVRIQAENADSVLTVWLGERPVLSYQLGESLPSDTLPVYYRRSGFLHPVLSPAGDTLTDDFPVGHTHQHGIFTAWVNTRWQGRKVDFWNQQDESGAVRHISIDTIESGPVFARLGISLEHIARPAQAVLSEYWELLVYAGSTYHLWDLYSTQKNISRDTLYLLPYHYGGLGIRGARYWNEVDRENYLGPARFLSPSGQQRDSLNHSRPEWLAMYGPTPGGQAGLQVIDHPDNPRFPQPVRVHPTMPYFSYTAVVGQGKDLAPGEAWQFRYRFLSFDGPPDAGTMERVAKAFIQPVYIVED